MARIDRRHLLRSVGAAGLVVLGARVVVRRGVAPISDTAPEPAVLPLGEAVLLKDMHLDTFLPLQGSRFDVRGTDSVEPLTLVGVKDWSPRHPPGWESFSLRFSAPTHLSLVQDTYHFWHPALGHFQLLVVPMDGNGHHQFLEAVVHRLPAAA